LGLYFLISYSTSETAIPIWRQSLIYSFKDWLFSCGYLAMAISLWLFRCGYFVAAV